MKYKEEFSKIRQKKLWNAIKFANLISVGLMTFDQHSEFIKEGIKTFEEQKKKLAQIKKENERKREKEKEKEKNEEDNYDIIIDDFKNNDIEKIVDSINKENNNNQELINKDNNKNNSKIIDKDRNSNPEIINKDNINNNDNNKKNLIENSTNNNINNNIITNNNIKDIIINKEKESNNKKKEIIGNKKRMLGRKRSNMPNSMKHRLMMDLILSIDDFIYNKRNLKINEYDLFFEDIQLKISQNKLNTNGLNVSKYIL